MPKGFQRSPGNLILINFEGIDGSGKTTVSQIIEELLRDRGIPCVHTRANAQLQSTISRDIRSLSRNPNALMMAPWTEALLYLAREHQLLKEKIEPYKDEDMVILTDRFFFSHLVLSTFGRGLDPKMIHSLVDVLSCGIKPDQTFFMDVDILTSRVRKKIQKVKNGAVLNFGRKGGCGIVLREKVRNGFIELSKSNPDWELVENSSQPIEEVCYRIAKTLQSKFPQLINLGEGQKSQLNIRPLFPLKCVVSPPSLQVAKIKESFYETLKFFKEDVQAYYLCGIGSDESMRIRKNIFSKAPEMTAESLRGVKGIDSERLFQKLLDYAPSHVLSRLPRRSPIPEFSKSIFNKLVAAHPREVLFALRGVDESWVWEIRKEQLKKNPDFVVYSVIGLDTEQAWEIRRAYHFDPALADSLLYSVSGMESERAWEIRDRFKEEFPAYLLLSLRGIGGDKAHVIRDGLVSFSPKLVVKSLKNVKDAYSYVLREKCMDAYPDVLASIKHDGSAAAEKIREGLWFKFPEGVLSSLGKLYNKVPLLENVWVHKVWKKYSDRLPFLKAIVEREDKKIRVYRLSAVENKKVV